MVDAARRLRSTAGLRRLWRRCGSDSGLTDLGGLGGIAIRTATACSRQPMPAPHAHCDTVGERPTARQT